MSTDFSIKPVGPSAANLGYGDPAFEAATPAVLARAQPEQKAATAPAAHSARAPVPAGADPLNHQVELDRAAATIVYRIVDSRSNLARGQFGEERHLRTRAYSRAEDFAKRNQAARKTDRRV